MITLDDIRSKSRLELIDLLFDDLSKGIVIQHRLLPPLVKVALLGEEKEAVLASLKRHVVDCERLVRDNDSNAIFLYGYMYQHGIGVDIDIDRAKELHEIGMALDNLNSINALGLIYDDLGNGKEARRLYETAYNKDNNHLDVAYNIANKYLKELDDPGVALDFYDYAIQKGHPAAMSGRVSLSLRQIQLEREDFVLDKDSSVNLLRLAIDGGNVSAVNYWARLTDNPTELIEYYKLAIKMGDINAMHHLANISAKDLARKHGITKILCATSVIGIYKTAIELYDSRAMRKCAEIFLDISNFSEAARLFRLSGVMDDRDSMRRLLELRRYNPIFVFHADMINAFYIRGLQDKPGLINKAVNSFVAANLAVSEFVEYEFQNHETDPINKERIILFLQSSEGVLDHDKLNELYLAVLQAIYNVNREVDEELRLQLVELSKFCLDKLDFNRVADFETLIVDIVIFIWKNDNSFLNRAAEILVSFSELIKDYQIPRTNYYLLNMTRIMVRATYGDEYMASPVNSSTLHILLDNFKSDDRLSLDDMNMRLAKKSTISERPDRRATPRVASATGGLFSAAPPRALAAEDSSSVARLTS